MRIWWCQEHEAQAALRINAPRTCWKSMTPTSCRMVPMRLIADDALVVEKENGKWPYWLRGLIPTGVPPGAKTSWRVWTVPEVLDWLEIKQTEVNAFLIQDPS